MEEYKKPLVAKFLQDFKAAAQQQSFVPILRNKNKDAMLELGLTRRNCLEEILSLSVEDFHATQDDKVKGGTLYIFGKQIVNQEFYIKLKLEEARGGKQRAKVISFHPSENPLKYPFREGKGGVKR